jgi:RNA binding exosome subunit
LTFRAATVSSNAFIVTDVQISVFTHATEDEEKVERAVRNVIPEDIVGVTMDRKRLKGHYSDPITLITAHIRKRKAATRMFQATIKNLSTLDQQRLLDEVEERVDKGGSLYLRLDKQRAFKDIEMLEEVDPIRMRFRFRIPHGTNPISFVRSCINAVVNGVEEQPIHEE